MVVLFAFANSSGCAYLGRDMSKIFTGLAGFDDILRVRWQAGIKRVRWVLGWHGVHVVLIHISISKTSVPCVDVHNFSHRICYSIHVFRSAPLHFGPYFAW